MKLTGEEIVSYIRARVADLEVIGVDPDDLSSILDDAAVRASQDWETGELVIAGEWLGPPPPGPWTDQ